MLKMIRDEIKKNTFFQVYNFLSCSAEGIQTVIFLWLIYHETHSAMLVSLTIVSSYLPSAILGFIFLKQADMNSPGRQLLFSNICLGAISLTVYLILVNSEGLGLLTLIIFYFTQAVLSVVKMFNKTSQNRIIRQTFAKADAIRALQLASSGMQAAQVLGAAIGGWAISTGYYMHALMLTCFIYFLNIYVSSLFERGGKNNKDAKAIRPVNSAATEKTSLSFLFGRKSFLLPLIFTVPSSGALQFLNTSLPSLSSLYSNSENIYPLLNITLQVAVIFSGIVAALNLLSLKSSLSLSLLISGISVLLMYFTAGHLYALYFFLFTTCLFISWHMISIKVLTNQMPDINHIGKFTMVRNSVASCVKIVFSLSSGVLLTFYSIKTTYLILAMILIFFNLLWFYQNRFFDYEGLDDA
ncbi:MFS transporter [Pantoea agglomerans]|uniref:MFS transporter n=1 Tax=Enterobacter agglomerans TaxID=549 RepID=UPI003C79B493